MFPGKEEKDITNSPTNLPLSQFIESSAVCHSGHASVPRSEAGPGTVPPWPARPVGNMCDSVSAGHAVDGWLDYLA